MELKTVKTVCYVLVGVYTALLVLMLLTGEKWLGLVSLAVLVGYGIVVFAHWRCPSCGSFLGPLWIRCCPSCGHRIEEEKESS